MRLIDADALKSKIREQSWKQETKVSLMLDWIYMLIDEASTVSTVQNKALQQENKQLRKEKDQAIRDIDKGNCRSCVYDGKKICYGNMHGKDREVAKEQGLPYCIGWQWRGLEGRE